MNYEFWHKRSEDGDPEDGTVCCFHVKGRKPDNVSFGWYGWGAYVERSNSSIRMSKGSVSTFLPARVDYYLPIPVLPEGE